MPDAVTTPPFAFGSAGGVPTHATGIVVVDLARVRSNWRALAGLVAPAECAAVVKADAYGLGADHVIPALAAEGCRTFFVATPQEAATARSLAPSAVVYVLDGVLDPGWLGTIGARPILSNMSDIDRWKAYRARTGTSALAGLQLETGLNRLGIVRGDFVRLIAQGDIVSQLGLTLVMSHLACADDARHPMNGAQRARFLAAAAELPAVTASLAASDGLMLGAAYHFDMVRPGYALYGGQAFDGGAAPVVPAVSVHARILQVREVAAGESVGYAASWTAPAPCRVATIAAGYADGFFRHASAADGETGGLVAVAGRLCRVIGRVSMDLVTIDVSDVPSAVADPTHAHGWAEIVGPSLSIEAVGARAGTIGYEVLTRLGRRFHRVYRT